MDMVRWVEVEVAWTNCVVKETNFPHQEKRALRLAFVAQGVPVAALFPVGKEEMQIGIPPDVRRFIVLLPLLLFSLQNR